MRTVRKCDFIFLTEWFYPVFKKTILSGQCRSTYIPYISLQNVTRFEPITATHLDQRYNNINYSRQQLSHTEISWNRWRKI